MTTAQTSKRATWSTDFPSAPRSGHHLDPRRPTTAPTSRRSRPPAQPTVRARPPGARALQHVDEPVGRATPLQPPRVYPAAVMAHLGPGGPPPGTPSPTLSHGPDPGAGRRTPT